MLETCDSFVYGFWFLVIFCRFLWLIFILLIFFWGMQLLQQLHSENMLGYRFPIGLEEQIKKWDPETIKAFHERWYFPANATLFIVGDIGSVSRTVEMIEVLQTIFLSFCTSML
jgi:hypothetical protein